MTMALHILLVDDRPDTVLFLGEFLLARGHRVETAGSGAEALEAIVRRTRGGDAYDLLISDVTMPGMDGVALVRELRRRQLLIPTALYTGFSAVNPHLQQHAAQLECLAVMEKPLELRRIERLVEEVIARRTGTARRSLTGRATRDENQPFFGTTSRAIVRPGGLRPDAASSEPRTGALERKSDLHMVVREPAPPPLELPPPPAATGQTGAFTAQLGRRGGAAREPAQVPGTDPFTAPEGQRSKVPLPPAPVLPPLPLPGAPAPGSEVRTRHPTAITQAFTPPEVEHQPTTTVVRRQAGLFAQNGGQQASLSSTRIRRGVGGSRPLTPPPGHLDQPPPSAQPLTSSSRAVACAHCRRVFVVMVKQESFTAMCVNCGQLNRIDPM